MWQLRYILELLSRWVAEAGANGRHSAAAFIVIMNTVVDILYAVLDPRVRLS